MEDDVSLENVIHQTSSLDDLWFVDGGHQDGQGYDDSNLWVRLFDVLEDASPNGQVESSYNGCVTHLIESLIDIS